jgi:ParB family chromosome partitioning protein
MATIKPSLIRRNTDQSAMARALGEATSAKLETTSPTQQRQVDYVIGQRYQIPLNQLQRSENNARYFYSTEELDEMAKSLRDKGQEIPAWGYVRNDKVILVDGQKRLQAATIAGFGALDVLIGNEPTNDGDEYEKSRRINLERSTQTSLDDAVRWQSFIAKGTYKNQEELSQRLQVSKATVSKTLSINNIPLRLLRMMSDHQQTRSLSIAYEISTLFTSDKFKNDPDTAQLAAQDVIEDVIKKELSRNQVGAIIANKLEGIRSRERAVSSPVTYGESEGVLKVFPSRGQIDLSFRGLEPEKVHQLKVLIEQMLAGQMSI